MARLYTKTKNRGGKATYRCERGREQIKPGETYYEWTTRAGGRGKGVTHRRCHRHKPRPSELTTSEHRKMAYAQRESIEDAVTSFRADHDHESLKSALEDAKTEIESHVETIEERISNMEERFPNGCPTLETLNDYKDNFEEFARNIEEAVNSLESFDWSGTVEFDYEGQTVRIDVDDARDEITSDNFDIETLDFEIEEGAGFYEAANEARDELLKGKTDEAAQYAEDVECSV
jgi:hypothetical protein